MDFTVDYTVNFTVEFPTCTTLWTTTLCGLHSFEFRRNGQSVQIVSRVSARVKEMGGRGRGGGGLDSEKGDSNPRLSLAFLSLDF